MSNDKELRVHDTWGVNVMFSLYIQLGKRKDVWPYANREKPKLRKERKG